MEFPKDVTQSKLPMYTRMTNEERNQLASNLNNVLDEFVKGLQAKSDKWKEDADWHKGMKSHPFFMKALPNDDGQVSPLFEGLQQLKCSAEENPRDELAESYKEDGNFNFQFKNYRKAIISYTEGLRQEISNPILRAQLLNNRAAAHWELQNFRSCYEDCKAALKTSKYVKPERRLAHVCFELGFFNECIQWCDELLDGTVDDMLSALRLRALKEQNIRNRDKRRGEKKKKRDEARKEALKKMIEEKGIKFLDKPFWGQQNKVLDHRVKVDGEHLIWPVVILYPEYKRSDIIEYFHEEYTFQQQFNEIFEHPPVWDTERKYTPKSVIVHYKDIYGRIHMVDKNSTLGSVLKEPYFRVDGSTPSFIIHAKESESYRRFLSYYY